MGLWEKLSGILSQLSDEEYRELAETVEDAIETAREQGFSTGYHEGYEAGYTEGTLQ